MPFTRRAGLLAAMLMGSLATAHESAPRPEARADGEPEVGADAKNDSFTRTPQLYLTAGFSHQPYATVSGGWANGIIAGLTVGVGYYADGVPNPERGSPLSSKFSLSVGAYFSWTFINLFSKGVPLVMGPEITLLTVLSPGHPLDDNVVAPGWALWVAPWQGPVLLGFAYALRISFVKGLQPTIQLMSPAARLAIHFG
jgi:hypothetical protein